MPAPFHSKAFVLLYNFKTSWALIGRLSRGFSAISGASNFKHFEQLFMTILFGLLTIRDGASLSNLLFCIQPSLKLFQLIYSWRLVVPLVSCLQNLHFSMIILLPNMRIFPVFLAISATNKPVNRSIHGYALTQLNVFALRGFIFRDIHKKTRKKFEQSGL